MRLNFYVYMILSSLKITVCPDPSPENGSVVCHDFSAFSAVQIQCEKGFQVKGNETVTCLPNGTWTDNVTCAEISKYSSPKIYHNRAKESLKTITFMNIFYLNGKVIFLSGGMLLLNNT